jgi:hypothetical protein
VIAFNRQHQEGDAASSHADDPKVRELLANAAAARAQAEAFERAAEDRIALLAEVAYHRRGKGNDFERSFRAMAESRGLVVGKPTSRQHDCVVNGMRVECKHKEGEYVSLLTTPVIGRDYCGYLRDDWDVLALWNQGALRIIPAAALLHDDGKRIRNHLVPSAFGEWVDRWDVFGDGFTARVERQAMLFGGDE